MRAMVMMIWLEIWQGITRWDNSKVDGYACNKYTQAMVLNIAYREL